MPDIYLYEGTDVLKNLLDTRDRKILDECFQAEGESMETDRPLRGQRDR